jgi:hypothetical protein
MQTTTGNSISTMGPISSSLGVDHDNDVIYIWLNPIVMAYVSGTSPNQTLNWTGLLSNSCDPTTSVGAPTLYQDVAGCDPNQYPYPDIIGIPVWCLKNPYYPAQGCAQWLRYTSRSWDNSHWGIDSNTGLPLGPGLTMRDYADILQADPFVAMNGNSVNVCHPSYGPSLDPNEPEAPTAPPVSAPVAIGTGGSCTVQPTIQLGVSSAGALNGCSTILQAGAGCTGSSVQFNVMGGGGTGGTGGTVTVQGTDWANGALTSLASCTATGGSGYKTPSSGALPTGAVNLANPTASPNFDLVSCGNLNPGEASYNRFQPYGTVEYPVPGPNGLPSNYAGTFQYSQTTTNTNIVTDSHNVGLSESVSLTVGKCFFACATFTWSNSDSTTWQNQNNMAETSENTAYANYSITGPQLSDNYTGPATYNVYLDNVYGTYAFYSDMNTPVVPYDLGNIGINLSTTPCVPQNTAPCLTFSPSVPVPVLPEQWGSGSLKTSPATQTVTLTNYSQYSMTMAGPALTFSDPAFQIVSSSDTCSNTVLAAYNTSGTNNWGLPAYECSLTVAFEPVASDVAKTLFGQSQVVNSYMVAAGTVNAPGDQNILVSNYGVVTGTAAPATNYATLYPTPIQNPYVSLQNPGAPNLFVFAVSGTPQLFTFTNLYPYPVTISKIILTDTADFKIIEGNTSYPDQCTGATIQPVPAGSTSVPASATCTFDLQFNQNQLEVQTRVSAVGTVNKPGVASALLPTVVLAGAAADGPPMPQLSVWPTTAYLSGDYIVACPSNNYADWCKTGWRNSSPSSTPITISNNSPYTISLTGGCASSLASGASCSWYVSDNATLNCTGPVTDTPSGFNYDTYTCASDSTESFTINPTVLGFAETPITVTVYIDNSLTSYGTPLSGPSPSTQIVVRGSELSNQVTTAATPATGTIQLSSASTPVNSHAAVAESRRRDSEKDPSLRTPARLLRVSPTFTQSTLSVGVGGFTKAVTVPSGTAINDAATMLAAQLNAAGSPVKAVASGPVVNLTSVTTGSSANLPLSAFVIGKYQVTPSGKALTGGQSASTVTNYDSGTVQVTTHGVTASAPWGSASTPESIATALAAAINQIAGSYWNATASGGAVTLTSVSAPSTSVRPATGRIGTAARRATPEAARTVQTVAKPEAATTPATSNQIVVTVIDSAGFAQPSFSATTN